MTETNQLPPQEKQPDDAPVELDVLLEEELARPEEPSSAAEPIAEPESGGDPISSAMPESGGEAKDSTAEQEFSPETAEKGLLGSFPLPRIYWKREHIRGYQVGDLISDNPLLIHPNATLVGNVIAPKVTVAGTLSGSVIAEDVRVANTGQIWGDLYAVRISIERGGQVQGWTCSVTTESYAQIREEGVFPAEPPAGEGERDERDIVQLVILRRLQETTAVALSARAELEHDFERRLSEVAKGASSKINFLSEQLSERGDELLAQQNQFNEAADELLQQKSQLDRQIIELTSAHDLINRQNQELATLQTKQETLQERHDALQEEKLQVEEALEANERRVEQLSDKVHSLEIAHKNSIQHSVDQEEALIRWQELAETTEKQLQEQESELMESRQILLAKRQTIADLQAEKKDLETKLAALFASVAEADETITISMDAQLLATQLTELEAERDDEEYNHIEQLLWYKANLETSRAAMESLQDQVAALEVESTRLQQELQQKQSRIIELEEQLIDKAAMSEEAAAMDGDGDLHVRLTRAQEQLAAQEADIAQYVAAIEEQGERLAEIQAEFEKREIQLEKAYSKLDKAKAMVDKQSTFIQQLQTITSDKIRNLQEEVEAARHHKENF